MILTDDLFVQYGGQTGTTSPASRSLAYQVAEVQVREYLGYPLSSEQITGEYPATWLGEQFALQYTNVRSLDYVAIVTLTGTHEVQEELSCGTYLIDNEKGLVDTRPLSRLRGASGIGIRLVYTTGLDSGTFSSDPTSMMALVAAAQIVLNELAVPGLSEGRVGIQEFTNMKYTEKRFKLHDTVFGSSAAAQYITKLLDRRKPRRVGRL